MTELKPCPFCGGRAFMLNEKEEAGTLHRVYCGNEDCHVEPKTHWYWKKEQAIETWNRRATDE